MSPLKRNLIANYLGQGWVALMGLAFIPVYIRFLGVESYGLIGFFSVMQTWLALLDMGMTPTLNREMARFKAGAHSAQSIRDLLRSLEILCFSIAALIAVSVLSASGYLASHWLQAKQLSVQTVADALSVMALVVALRFVEGVYRGSLFGLQRQVWYNAASAVLATIRHGGAVAILALVSPTISAFFLWQAAISIVSILVFGVTVHRSLPAAPTPARFSRAALTGVWKYAGGMLGITLLSVLLTQVDKILLSRMLELSAFGYYILAATVAGALYMVISPITQSVFPRMVELATRHEEAVLISTYHQGAQLVTVLTAPAVMLLCFFAGGAIYAWSGDGSLAMHTAPILMPLALGTFLNGLMWMPHQCQLAHGWTSLALKTNLVAVLLLVPAIIWVVPQNGAVGAAWIWVALNVGYILIAQQFMHAKLLRHEKWAWYGKDVLLPLLGAALVMLLAWRFQPDAFEDRWHWIAFLSCTGLIAMLGSLALANLLRPRALSLIDRALHRPARAPQASTGNDRP
ncbi:MAG: oligosaccharide flippase family protein [Pseudomonadota bacterium]|nr:oligosaccharide flippase family protein [Pseudomonadota bacterium]